MSDPDELLAGIAADPHEETRWLVLADWLEEHDDPRRSELPRLHRRLLATCCDPDAHPERAVGHARMMELFRAGVEHQVTQAQWFSVVGTNPSRHLTDGSEWDAPVNELWRRAQGQCLPVESVAWADAVAFCRKLSGTGHTVRLPTEAEWEYACRAGTSTPFFWGGEEHYQARIDWNGNYSQGGGDWTNCTCPVGTYATICPHPWGLADVHGNVWEWCLDGHDAGHEDARSDRMMARGGSWADTPRHCRAASRCRHSPTGGDDVGFRVVFCLEGGHPQPAHVRVDCQHVSQTRAGRNCAFSHFFCPPVDGPAAQSGVSGANLLPPTKT